MGIDVTDLDPWELLAALYHGSRVSPTSVCRMQSRGDITAEEAKAEAEQWSARKSGEVPHYPDYLFGRPIKAFLRKEGDTICLARADLYDRDMGEGECARIVASLMASAPSTGR